MATIAGDPAEAEGWTARDVGDRLFIEAVLFRAKTGMPWRDLPERFGPWKSVYNRFNNWAKKSRWELIFKALQLEIDASAVIGSKPERPRKLPKSRALYSKRYLTRARVRGIGLELRNRVLLPQLETLPRHRHALREDGTELPRTHPGRMRMAMACTKLGDITRGHRPGRLSAPKSRFHRELQISVFD
jgi:transposase